MELWSHTQELIIASRMATRPANPSTGMPRIERSALDLQALIFTGVLTDFFLLHHPRERQLTHAAWSGPSRTHQLTKHSTTQLARR